MGGQKKRSKLSERNSRITSEQQREAKRKRSLRNLELELELTQEQVMQNIDLRGTTNA